MQYKDLKKFYILVENGFYVESFKDLKKFRNMNLKKKRAALTTQFKNQSK